MTPPTIRPTNASTARPRLAAAAMQPAATTLAVTAMLMLGGCGEGKADGPSEQASSASVTPPPTSTASTSTPATPDPGSNRTPHTPEEDTMQNARQLTITVTGQRLTATLDDSPAAADLLAQLPVTVDMTDHGGVEKTGRLPGPLSLQGQPDGSDPDIGDLGYYAPGNDLVLYYGDQSYHPGIVVLGRLNDGAADRIAAINGDVTVEAR